MRLLRSILYRLYAIYDKACPLRYFIQKIRLYYAKNVICRSGSRFANTVFEGDNLVHKRSLLVDSYLSRHSYIAFDCRLFGARIGKFCSIGPRVYTGFSNHPTDTFVSTFLAFLKILVKYLATRITLDYSLDLKCIGKLPRDIWLISDMMCGSGLM